MGFVCFDLIFISGDPLIQKELLNFIDWGVLRSLPDLVLPKKSILEIANGDLLIGLVQSGARFENDYSHACQS